MHNIIKFAPIVGQSLTIANTIAFAAPPFGALLLMAIPMFGVLMVDIVTAAMICQDKRH